MLSKAIITKWVVHEALDRELNWWADDAFSWELETVPDADECHGVSMACEIRIQRNKYGYSERHEALHTWPWTTVFIDHDSEELKFFTHVDDDQGSDLGDLRMWMLLSLPDVEFGQKAA